MDASYFPSKIPKKRSPIQALKHLHKNTIKATYSAPGKIAKLSEIYKSC